MDEPKRYRVALRADVEVAMRHAAIARRATVSELIAIAVNELVERDGWLGRQMLAVTSDTIRGSND